MAKLTRARSRAKFILLTGSSGKTTTASLLAHILSGEFIVRSQVHLNSFSDAARAISKMTPYDEFVVIEAGANAPGDLKKVSELVQPHVSIVTLVALEHYAGFRKIEAVATEKSTIVTALRPDGLAVLNFDDPRVREMSTSTAARTVTFGGAGADYQVLNARLSAKGELALSIVHDDQFIALETRLVGLHNTLAVAAAAATAIELGSSAENIRKALQTFEPVKFRLSRHEVPNGPTFLLDTYKAPYHSIALPLTTLKSIDAPRKRFILGQISDYSGNPRKKYRDTYRSAKEVADQVIFVGPHSHRAKAGEAEVAAGTFKAFSTARELSPYLKETAVPGEVIVVKSSLNLHLERLFIDWNTPVRCWVAECGLKTDCLTCGLYNRPYEEHGGKRSKRKA